MNAGQEPKYLNELDELKATIQIIKIETQQILAILKETLKQQNKKENE